ncbi:penicillin-binding protein 2 [Campylobacter sp. LR291e]|uniref:penicillin-binding protein 2 n=1 Tax=Campylobacter sp. LR291e TaxID=2593546 RepID=UPI001239C870|nr:penicillin-binding protein 2 [Campylobacter sp. LR291e]KAA6233649.1 penicillin-binding protein 2 [Campylobacter sp. LR291e]
MKVRIVIAFVLIFFIFLLSRVYYLSIKSNIYYEELAKQNAIKTKFLAPARGQIIDRNGTHLAINDLSFSISIKPYLHIRKKNRPILEREINNIVHFFPDLNASTLMRNYMAGDSYYNQEFIKVVDLVTYDAITPYFSILSLNDNIKIEPIITRKYPFNSLASHIIGYVGKSNLQDISENEIAKLANYTGKSGIERYYNTILQGTKGIQTYKVNALNKILEEVTYNIPESDNIHLTIDFELQKYLSELFNENAGAVVVMDVKNGEILAAGSFPEYDLNPFVTGISTKDWNELTNNLDHPFSNKLINGLYPPGSVVKMGVALSFLNTNSINRFTSFYCSGGVELRDRVFRCWNRTGHGRVDLKHGIQHSCDVYFYEGSIRAGITQISSTLGRIGFGVKTGIDLPNEFVGTVPSREWKQQKFKQPWVQGDTLNTSIGQGNFLVTPMQIARYTAQIASGKEVIPHLNKELKYDKKDVYTLVEQSNLPYIREAMYAVANEPGGTAFRYLNNLPVKIAAKTGTAQVVGFSQKDKNRVIESMLEYYTRSHSWLTAYAPYDNPKYSITVLVEHGGRTITSGVAMASIVRKMNEMGYFK